MHRCAGLANPSVCISNNTELSFTAAMPLGVSGVKRDAALNADLLYRCPTPANFARENACILWSNAFFTQPCNITSVLEMPAAPEYGTDYAVKTSVGVEIDHADGRQSMAIFMDCAFWQPTCMVLGHVVVSWVLHDIIPGQRRAMLSTHVSDVCESMGYLLNSSQRDTDKASWQTQPAPQNQECPSIVHWQQFAELLCRL
jgi:hypothetical protein